MTREKGLQGRLLAQRRESRHPDKWVRSIDAYRALDDAVMEGGIKVSLRQFLPEHLDDLI